MRRAGAATMLEWGLHGDCRMDATCFGLTGYSRNQKMYFSASCTRRGARNVLIWPNTVLVRLVEAKPSGLTQFSVLNVSRRNCSLERSVTVKFLRSEASRLKK